MANDAINRARNDLILNTRCAIVEGCEGPVAGERVFVIMHDPTQQVCSVFARDAEHARKIIGELLDTDVSDQPVYDVAKDEDVQSIIGIIARHMQG